PHHSHHHFRNRHAPRRGVSVPRLAPHRLAPSHAYPRDEMGIGAVTNPAVFLDRDGVLNALVLNPATGRMESPLSPGDFNLLEGVVPALLRLQEAGLPLILVSNQPNFALGKSSLETLGAIHTRFANELIGGGIRFTRFCYCLHHPRGVAPGYSGLCVCRKPSPWFLLRARDDFGYSL